MGLQCTRFRSSSAARIRGDTTSSSLSGHDDEGPAADSAGASCAAACMNGFVETARCCPCDDVRGPNDVRLSLGGKALDWMDRLARGCVGVAYASPQFKRPTGGGDSDRVVSRQNGLIRRVQHRPNAMQAHGWRRAAAAGRWGALSSVEGAEAPPTCGAASCSFDLVGQLELLVFRRSDAGVAAAALSPRSACRLARRSTASCFRRSMSAATCQTRHPASVTPQFERPTGGTHAATAERGGAERRRTCASCACRVLRSV